MKLPFKKGQILIILIGILVVISLNFYQKEVKNFFYLISSPIQRNLWQGGSNISGFFEGFFRGAALEKENEELKFKIQELLTENVRLKELEKENKTLREALALGLEKDFQLIAVKVIGKDIFQDSIFIDKGLKDGIFVDLPVITQQKGLVGKVVEVHKNFSRIMLTSNKESSFDAEIFERDACGVVKGKGGSELYLDKIEKEKEIFEGDLILTSALGGFFPKELLVGKIKSIKKSDIEPFQTAEIVPNFNLNELDTLFIIASF